MKKIILVLITLALLFGCVGWKNDLNDENEYYVIDQVPVLDKNKNPNPNLSNSEYVISDDEDFVLADSIKLRAIREKNADICKQITYLSVKENCFLNVAIVLKDESICKEIDSNNVQKECFNAIQRRRN